MKIRCNLGKDPSLLTWISWKNLWATEASSIGLSPGVWADEIIVRFPNRKEVTYRKADAVMENNEVLYYNYTAADSCIHVYND